MCRSPAGCMTWLVAAEAQGAGRAGAAPFAQHGPGAKQVRFDPRQIKSIDIAGGVGAGEKGHVGRLREGVVVRTFTRSSRTVLQVLLIVASAAAAVFWIISAMQPLTLTLDSLQAELHAAAWYNRNAAWAAGVAAVCQALRSLVGWLGQ
jgi:hypothetical protein